MILVTVGNLYYRFDRLVKKMDEIAASSPEKIVMQVGASGYKPAHCECVEFVGYSEMQELNRRARVIVSHAGVGSILTALELNKPMILVPRLKKNGEAYDDHQLEIAERLSGLEIVKVLYDVDLLPEALACDFDLSGFRRSNVLVKRLGAYLNEAAIRN